MTPTNIITQLHKFHIHTSIPYTLGTQMAICTFLCVRKLMSYIPVCAKTYVLYSCVCENLCLKFLCVRKFMSYIPVCAKTPGIYRYGL